MNRVIEFFRSFLLLELLRGLALTGRHLFARHRPPCPLVAVGHQRAAQGVIQFRQFLVHRRGRRGSDGRLRGCCQC